MLQLISETPAFHTLALETIERDPTGYLALQLRPHLNEMRVIDSNVNAPAMKALEAGPSASEPELIEPEPVDDRYDSSQLADLMTEVLPEIVVDEDLEQTASMPIIDVKARKAPAKKAAPRKPRQR